MPVEKNVREDLMSKPDPSGTVQKKIALVSGITDRLYRLIEKDEGVPFHLVYDNESGSGHYLFIGEGIRDITGFEPGSFTERTLNDITREVVPLSENVPADNCMLRNLILQGEIQEYRIERCIVSRSGERKWIRETAVQHAESGFVTGLIGIYHDITEKKKYSIKLENAIREASESERLKNNFLQNISHEVRTPLNAIVGFSAMLSEPELDYGKKVEFARMINTSTDELLNIMENIIEISRIDAGSEEITVKDVKPSELLNKIYKTFYNKALENNISLECSIPPDSEISIPTDGYKLFQVIYNLTGNAIKFTQEGKVEFGYNILGNNIEFYVSDTGIGISDHDKPKIFNKFYQADSGSTRRYAGTGLGLTIAKAYAEMLGGSLSFQSSEGEGSVFRFTLPF
ncbi:MAG TPA: PAS domain-containing sensor histidine kinase [Bacteroidales bacterium]|nr:PAS domain-containing sensor histidine kinase [Bacteroidales bacterium]